MTKEVTICDVCNKEIADNEPIYSIRYGGISTCHYNIDVCKECLSKGLVYVKSINSFKIADVDDNVTGIPGERQAY